MNKIKVNEILEKVQEEWTKRLKNGYYTNVPKKANVDKSFLETLRKMLKKCPDEDGFKRVMSVETGKTHLVPYTDIILNGLKGTELHKYTIENEKSKKCLLQS